MQPASWPENNSLFCEPIVPPWGTVALLSPAAGQFSVLSFVHIRVNSWFKTSSSEEPAGQISGSKARATEIRAHSCPFVFIRGSRRPAAKILQGRSRARKHELQKFVSIRVHSWFQTTRSEEPAGQISGSKARATKIRDHSCPFVVQNDPLRRTCRTNLGLEARTTKIRAHSCPFVVQNDPQRRTLQGRTRARNPELQKFVSIRVHSCPFVSIRGSKRPAAKTLQDRSRALQPELQKFVTIRVHSWFKTTRCEEPAGQNSGSKAQATKIRVHSCPFVVQNDPLRRTCRTDLGLESPSYKNSCPFVPIRGSKRPAAKTLQGRTRALQPELHEIRVHSW